MNNYSFKKIYRVKNHLLYAALAQIIIMTVNVLILVSSNFKIPYTIFQSVVPTYFYLAFIVLFYLLMNKFNNKVHHQSVFTRILNFTIIGVNIVYTLITTFDEEGALYYLDTVIVQTINAFYMMVYVTSNGKQFAHGAQLNFLRIFGYASAVCALLAFYFCFVNMLVAWSFIVVTTVLLFFTYLLMHENLKRTLSRRKRLRSLARRRAAQS